MKLVSLCGPLRGLLRLIVISGAVYLECDNNEIGVSSSAEKLASLSSYKSQPRTPPWTDSASSSSAGSSEEVNSQLGSTFSDAPPGEMDIHTSSPSDILGNVGKDGVQPHAPRPVRSDDNSTSTLLSSHKLVHSPRVRSKTLSDPGIEPRTLPGRGVNASPPVASSTRWDRTDIASRGWKDSPRRKHTVPAEHTEAWLRTRKVSVSLNYPGIA